jgi:hypothetical protein
LGGKSSRFRLAGSEQCSVLPDVLVAFSDKELAGLIDPPPENLQPQLVLIPQDQVSTISGGGRGFTPLTYGAARTQASLARERRRLREAVAGQAIRAGEVAARC